MPWSKACTIRGQKIAPGLIHFQIDLLASDKTRAVRWNIAGMLFDARKGLAPVALTRLRRRA